MGNLPKELVQLFIENEETLTFGLENNKNITGYTTNLGYKQYAIWGLDKMWTYTLQDWDEFQKNKALYTSKLYRMI